MRVKIVFSYDGTMFCGYQRQINGRSVEEEFLKALFNINNHKKTSIVASGRTDRGVHAIGQTAHFDIDVDITLYKLKCALNSILPDDIHVISTKKVDNDFHARFMAKRKTYKYVLNMGEYDPLKRNYEYQYNRKLDIKKFQSATKYFVGKHDFKNFVSNEAVKDNYEREIYEARVEEIDDKLIFTFVGNGFMKYQVRNMVGTLLRVAQDKVNDSYIKDLLEFKADSNKVFTIGSEGLYLVSVEY